MKKYDPTKDSEWVTCSEAARRCGVSRQAVRDRIRRGSLEWMPDAVNPRTKLVCVKELAKTKKAGCPVGTKRRVKRIKVDYHPSGYVCTGFPMCGNCKHGKKKTADGNETEYRFCRKQNGLEVGQYSHCVKFEFTAEALKRWKSWSRKHDYTHREKKIDHKNEFWVCPHCMKFNQPGNYFCCANDCAYTADHVQAVYCATFRPEVIGKYRTEEPELPEPGASEIPDGNKISLSDEQFKMLFKRYEAGSNVHCLRKEFPDLHDSGDFDWWEAAFDAMIDWAFERELIA